MYILSNEDFEALSADFHLSVMKPDGGERSMLPLLLRRIGAENIQCTRILTAFDKNGSTEHALGKLIVVKKGLVLFDPVFEDTHLVTLCGGILERGEGQCLYKIRCFDSANTYFEIRRASLALKMHWGNRVDERGDHSLYFSEARWAEMAQWLNQWLPSEIATAPRSRSSRS